MSTTCHLRALDGNDSAQWCSWMNRQDVMDGLDRAKPVTAEQHEDYIEKNVTKNENAIWFAIEAEDGVYVGNVWLWDIHWRHRRAEMRIFVAHEGYQGRGIGTAAIEQISAYASSVLGLHKVYAYVHETNVPSQKAFQAAGFAVEAKLNEEAYRDGAFHAVLRLAKILN